MRIYAIRDQKTSSYQAVHAAMSDVEATRQLAIAVCTDKIQLSMFPEDFSLHVIGSIDLSSGTITPIIPPMFVVSAVDAKKMLGNKGE